LAVVVAGKEGILMGIASIFTKLFKWLWRPTVNALELEPPFIAINARRFTTVGRPRLHVGNPWRLSAVIRTPSDEEASLLSAWMDSGDDQFVAMRECGLLFSGDAFITELCLNHDHSSRIATVTVEFVGVGRLNRSAA
jgi:hypothetical protein